MIMDLKVSLFSLSKAKGYTLTVVISLGLTLGVLITLFNLNYHILFAPMPYPDEDDIVISRGQEVYLNNVEFSGNASIASVVASYKQLKIQRQTVSLLEFSRDVIRSFADTPEIDITFISPEYLSIFDVPFVIGRGLNSEEGINTHRAVAMISYELWQQRFSGSESVIGQSLLIGETSFKIIGVTAKGFIEPKLAAPGRTTEVWVPWDYNPSHRRYGHNWGAFFSWSHIVAKVPEAERAITEQQLSNALNQQFQEATKGKNGFDGYSISSQLVPIREAIIGDTSKQTLLVMLGGLFLLLIAATNIVNVVSARMANQQKNFAIKAAVGAQRRHLFISIFSELLILISAASLLAFGLAFWGLNILKVLAAEALPMVLDLTLDVPTILFSILLLLTLASLLATVVYRQINFQQLNTQLQSSGKGTGIQVSSRVRRLLVIIQVMFTTILLVVCVHILLASLVMLNQDPGFLITERVNVRFNEIKPQIKTREQYDEYKQSRLADIFAVQSELKKHPQIERLSLGLTVPINYTGSTYQTSVISTTADFKIKHSFETIPADEQHLPIIGSELIQGRFYSAKESREQAAVMVINQAAAMKLAVNGEVLGTHYYWDNGVNNTRYKVVGVVKDYTIPGFEEPGRMWVPHGFDRDASMLVQLKTNQPITASTINAQLAKVSTRYRVQEINTLTENLQKYLFKQRMAIGAAISLSLFSIILTAVGIYGIIAYGITMRRNELGVRMAMGARFSLIIQQIFNENLKDVVVGIGYALAILLMLWGVVDTAWISVSIWGVLLPILLIVMLTMLVTLASTLNLLRAPISTIINQ